MKINEEQLLGEIAKQNFVIFLVLVGLSLFWMSLSVTLGVITGGLISVGGYAWLHRSVKKMINNPNRRSARKLQWSYVFRLIAIGVALFLVLAVLKVNPVALCFGLSVVVLSIIAATLRSI
ncbi:MAG: ATP synthase subunit I [Deltaproteobacteria bacterium]|nr:ATP synthase subunit I [Deltaproteobacteria bacterium]